MADPVARSPAESVELVAIPRYDRQVLKEPVFALGFLAWPGRDLIYEGRVGSPVPLCKRPPPKP